MAKKAPRFTRQHFEFIADFFGPITCPDGIVKMSEHLADTNPDFNAGRFTDRATSAWEAAHIDPHEDNLSMIESKNVA